MSTGYGYREGDTFSGVTIGVRVRKKGLSLFGIRHLMYLVRVLGVSVGAVGFSPRASFEWELSQRFGLFGTSGAERP